jgi:hypothetical protein
MFEAIIAKIAITTRNVVRAIGATVNMRPWLLPVAVAALFLVW